VIHLESVDVVIVSESASDNAEDRDALSSVPGFQVSSSTPLSLMLSLHSLNYGTVAVLELPFLQESEEEFLGILLKGPSPVPAVLVTDDPSKYLRHLGRGTVQLVLREPGYRNSLPDAIRDASNGARVISERDALEKRIQEYAQYLEIINKIMEHDIGDLNQAILTFSELLGRTEGKVSKHLVDNIIAQSKTVGNLINAFSNLARLAKGNVEELAFRVNLLRESIDIGVGKFLSEYGSNYEVTVNCGRDESVLGDAQLSNLFEYSLGLLTNIQKETRHFEVDVKEETALQKSAVITISPQGIPKHKIPRVMSHVDDIDALLRGNVDMMAVMILIRRYGGNASIGTLDVDGRPMTFLTLLLPLSA
jgi:signal transduction histidine kinase